jgi:FkbM family methyltransferase
MFNDRPVWLIQRNLLKWENYRALLRSSRVYVSPLASTARYFLGRGEYPQLTELRTPTGRVSVTLFNSHDAITVHEIFCRQDYALIDPPRVVVDVGSNIGISALYFLTRRRDAVCELYEPDPSNVAKLTKNLQGYEGRYVLHQAAVSDRPGKSRFRQEPTGRYGALIADGKSGVEDAGGGPLLDVDVEEINDVLQRAVSAHGAIDLVKIDTEGHEERTLAALSTEVLRHVRHIVVESFDSNLTVPGFERSVGCDVLMFTNAER